MLDAPDPVGDFPFALFVGRRFEDGSGPFIFILFFFCFLALGNLCFCNIITTTLTFPIDKTNLTRLHSDPFAALCRCFR